MTQTITRPSHRPRSSAGPRSYLVLALECDRPSAGAARYHLEHTEVVDLGRGAGRRATRPEPGALRIELPDHRVSATHAQIRRELGRFVIEDRQSKNGVLLNGQRQERALLADGDRILLGHTLFLFRTTTSAAPLLDLEAPDPERPVGMSTLSPELASDLERLRLVAQSPTAVLIQGESGTGKELIARAVHRFSGRKGPLVAVNCGALPVTLVESELFGHRRGAFSGALEERPGLVRSADGGTLFLDEVGDLPMSAQAVLLRVLQEKEVLAVGAVKPIKVDLRIVAATHRDLGAMVERGEFRHDLLARLSGFSLTLPRLRDRLEDLGVCIATLLRRMAGDAAARVQLDSEVATTLFAHDWPRNVRELEQQLSSALALAQGGGAGARIGLEHLPRLPAPDERSQSAPSKDSAERERLLELMRTHRGNVSAVARAEGKARMQIQRWLKRFRIDPRTFR